jgi:hypothetical protein
MDRTEASHKTALPNLVVIGAMKCGTSALHRYLGLHPEIEMSRPKELNFFFGSLSGPAGRGSEPEQWVEGNWHRGPAWYARHFSSKAPVRGESSPGYTSPSHTGVAERMRALVPGAKLVYLVRDPVERAISQYRHHCDQGTEKRSLEEALCDLGSQYLSRGLYYQRLEPFLRAFPRSQIAIVSREELLSDRQNTLRRLFGFVGVDEDFWTGALNILWRTSRGFTPPLPRRLKTRLAEVFEEDAQRLRAFAQRDFPGWSV